MTLSAVRAGSTPSTSLPGRLDLRSHVDDDFSRIVRFERDGTPVAVATAGFVAVVEAPQGAVPLTIDQVDASTWRLWADDDAGMGNDIFVAHWSLHHEPTDQPWLSGTFSRVRPRTGTVNDDPVVVTPLAADAPTVVVEVGGVPGDGSSPLVELVWDAATQTMTAIPGSVGSATIPLASSTSAGLMSPQDKAALDDIGNETGVLRLHHPHNQGTPSSTWVIPHGLGYHPNVTVLDSAGSEHVGFGIEHPDINTTVLTFPYEFGGTADLS